MSTSYSAAVIYGYALDADDLIKRTPNPLWGKVTFNPDTGERVTQWIETEIELKVRDGYDANAGEVARHNAGESIIIGVQLAETEDLCYGGGDPLVFSPIVGNALDDVTRKVQKVLAAAGLPFDEAQMGHYLVGSVY